MAEAIPPWECPAAVCAVGGGSRGIWAYLAKPEKSGDAKLRDWDVALTGGQGRYVRRTASKTGETL